MQSSALAWLTPLLCHALALNCAGRLGVPEDLVGPALFLTSRASDCELWLAALRRNVAFMACQHVSPSWRPELLSILTAPQVYVNLAHRSC